MKSLLTLIVLSIILTNCGFKPIYSTKNSNFEILSISNKNENKSSFSVEKIIMSLSNKDAKKKFKIDLDYDQSIKTILKDSKGDPSKKKLTINISLGVKNEEDNVIINQIFNEEFNYDVQKDKFNMAQYEDSIINNLVNKISNDILFFLGTLE